MNAPDDRKESDARWAAAAIQRLLRGVAEAPAPRPTLGGMLLARLGLTRKP